MIDPRDIFNANRVVGAPSQFRPTKIVRPMILPMRGTLRNAERRAAVTRAVTRAATERARTIRQGIVRNVAPLIRKR